MAKTFNELCEFAKTLTTTSPLMENREKGELKDIIGVQIIIKDFDFLEGDNGSYAVFIVEGIDDKFYFASSVLTEYLVALDENGFKEVIQSDGLPILLTKKKSKNNREYFAVKFFD